MAPAIGAGTAAVNVLRLCRRNCLMGRAQTPMKLRCSCRRLDGLLQVGTGLKLNGMAVKLVFQTRFLGSTQ